MAQTRFVLYLEGGRVYDDTYENSATIRKGDAQVSLVDTLIEEYKEGRNIHLVQIYEVNPYAADRLIRVIRPGATPANPPRIYPDVQRERWGCE